jgi:hypothetical protein
VNEYRPPHCRRQIVGKLEETCAIDLCAHRRHGAQLLDSLLKPGHALPPAGIGGEYGRQLTRTKGPQKTGAVLARTRRRGQSSGTK